MSARAGGPPRIEAEAVSALFDSPDAVDRAVARLVRAGMPRDLIDVAVSPEAAARFYRDRARPPGREAMRYAGIGGLIGLIVGSAISLILVAIPGFHDPGTTAIVQLIGPNFATVTGAVIGALIGLFTPRRTIRRFARAAEAPGSIVLIVTARSEEEAQRIYRILLESGGYDPRIESWR